jgi:hypothetical protein
MLALLLVPAIPVAPSGNGSYPPPSSGEWIITEDTNITNEPIYLNGNLTVQNGSLSLYMVTLFGNVSGAALSVTVAPNCSFIARNCMFRVSVAASLNFDFQGNTQIQISDFLRDDGDILIKPGNSTAMQVCEIEGTMAIPAFAEPNLSDIRIRHSSVGARLGNGAAINGSHQDEQTGEGIFFDECTWGLICEPGSVVSGCTFYKCGVGILLSDDVAVRDCFFPECVSGILAGTGARISAGNNVSDCVFSDCPQGISVGHNSSIVDCSFGGCDLAAEVIEGPAEMTDSTIAGNGTHLKIMSGHTNATSTTFFSDRAEVGEGAELEVRWNVNVSVLFHNGTPAPNASVQMTDRLNRSFQQKAASDGTVQVRRVKEYLKRHNETIFFTPYWFNASMDGLACNLSVNVNRNLNLGMALGDISAPSITIDTPANGSLLNRSLVTVTGRAFDETGNVSVRVRMDSGDWSTAGGAGNWSIPLNLTDGGHLIEAEAVDEAQNIATASVTVNVDTVPPSLRIMSPEQDILVNTTSVEISGLTEPGSALTIDGEVAPVSLGTFQVEKELREGPNRILIRVRDRAGNTASETRNVTRDTIPPAISISWPRDGFLTNIRNITVSGTLETGARIESAYDHIVINGSFFSFDKDLIEGCNTINIAAVDPAGNMDFVNVSVVLDTHPPTIDVQLANGAVVRKEVLELVGRVEPGSILTVNDIPVVPAMDGRFWTNLTLRIGDNDILVVARDGAGNTATLERTVIREEAEGPKPDGGGGSGSGSSLNAEWLVAAAIIAVAVIILLLALFPRRGSGLPSDIENPGAR